MAGTGSFRVALLFSLCVCPWATSLSCGADDGAALVQTSASTRSESGRAISVADLESSIVGTQAEWHDTLTKELAANQAVHMERLQKLTDSGEMAEALNAPDDPLAAELSEVAWHPSEVQRIKEEMRLGMKALTPGVNGDIASFLQNAGLQFNHSVKSERFTRDVDEVGKVWRRSTKLHETILNDIVPRLTELLSHEHLWKQMKQTAATLGNSSTKSSSAPFSLEPVLDNFPAMTRSGVVSLQRAGLNKILKDDPEDFWPQRVYDQMKKPLEDFRKAYNQYSPDCFTRAIKPKISKDEGKDFHLAGGTYHSLDWSPKAIVGLGARVTLAIQGYVQQGGYREFQDNGFKMDMDTSKLIFTAGVTVTHTFASGWTYAASLFFDFSNPCNSDSLGLPYSNYNIALDFGKLKTPPPSPAPSFQKGELKASYGQSSYAGMGVQNSTLSTDRTKKVAMNFDMTLAMGKIPVDPADFLMQIKPALGYYMKPAKVVKTQLSASWTISPKILQAEWPSVGLFFYVS